VLSKGTRSKTEIISYFHERSRRRRSRTATPKALTSNPEKRDHQPKGALDNWTNRRRDQLQRVFARGQSSSAGGNATRGIAAAKTGPRAAGYRVLRLDAADRAGHRVGHRGCAGRLGCGNSAGTVEPRRRRRCSRGGMTRARDCRRTLIWLTEPRRTVGW